MAVKKSRTLPGFVINVVVFFLSRKILLLALSRPKCSEIPTLSCIKTLSYGCCFK